MSHFVAQELDEFLFGHCQTWLEGDKGAGGFAPFFIRAWQQRPYPSPLDGGTAHFRFQSSKYSLHPR